MKVPVVLSATALAVALLAAVPAVHAAAEQLRPRSVTGQHIRLGAIQPAHFSPRARQWINANAPSPRARGVTVTAGEHGERVRVTAANIRNGDVIGQIEANIAGLACEGLGPWIQAQATFFDASGMAVDTGTYSETSPVTGVRYPLRILGARGAIRAEVVVSIACI